MLNAHYMALRVVSARRAFALLCKRDGSRQPVAEVVHVEQGEFISYHLDDWTKLSLRIRALEPDAHDWVHTVRVTILIPRIIRVLTFSSVPRQEVKFARRNVFARDNNTCQYCGKRFPSSDLSLDHVIPRSRGGQTTWENIVSACRRCNVRKGGRTPSEANMRLIRPARKPARCPALNGTLADRRYLAWRHFLDSVHWNVELS